jgi:hypothetical protein
MTFTEAAARVLRLVGKPLHYKEITDVAIEKNYLSHVGKSPEVTMGARLAALVKKGDKENPLVRIKPGVFALREWDQSTIDKGLADRTPALERLAAQGETEPEPEGAIGSMNLSDSEAEEEEALAEPDAEELQRAELAAGAQELFAPEDDDDRPIFMEEPESEEETEDEEQPREGSRRKRRRRRRSRADEEIRADDLPTYTVSDAPLDLDLPQVEREVKVDEARELAAEPDAERERPRERRDRDRDRERAEPRDRDRDRERAEPRDRAELRDRERAEPRDRDRDRDRAEPRDRDRAEPRERDRDRDRAELRDRDRDRDRAEPRDRDRDRDRAEPRDRDRDRDRGEARGASLDDLAGKDLAEAVHSLLQSYDRSRGPVPVQSLAESAQRRGRLSSEGQLGQTLIMAAVRADIARSAAQGARPRFRLVGSRVGLSEWLLDGELQRLERELNQLSHRYREAVRRVLLRQLQGLPHRALGELVALVLERVGMSELAPVRRPGTHGAELHLAGKLESGSTALRVAVVVRRDGREIGRERVTDLRGALHHYGPAQAGWIVTTGQVLSGAREEAAAPGAAPVNLVDGIGLARLCEEHSVGVVDSTMRLPAPDLDLLEALRSG